MSKGYAIYIFPLEKTKQNKLFHSGGQGSGNFDHSGRPGLVGGSGKGEGEMSKNIISDLRSSKNEKLYVLDPDGNILQETYGDIGFIDIYELPSGSLNLVHNHPDGSNISIGDLRYFSGNDKVEQITVVTRDRIQFVRVVDRDRLFRETGKASASVNVKMADGFMEGFITKSNKNEYLMKYTDEAVQQMVDSGIISMSYEE